MLRAAAMLCLLAGLARADETANPMEMPELTAPITVALASIDQPQTQAGADTAPSTDDGSRYDFHDFEPQWVSDEQFNHQLEIVHGKIPDPKIGLFGPDSMMWRVSRYIAPGGLGAGRALLLQISHPWITVGINEHSNTRADPLKRARDTFRYVLTMVYGSRQQALQAARDVRMIHARVKGTMPFQAGFFPKGSDYAANEVQAMVWVHATLWETLMLMYEQSVGPVSDADKERYYQETKLFAYLFGIPDSALPKNWDSFLVYCDKMRSDGHLQVTPATRELADYLFGWHGFLMWLPMQYEKVVTAANLPEDMRDAYGLSWGPTHELFYKGSMATIRGVHHVLPDSLLENPVYKEAMARVGDHWVWPFTKFELWVAFGDSHLVR